MCYHHIVIATDLSDDGKRLVEKGARLAEALQAKLSLIYVDVHYDTYHAAIGFSERSYDGVPFEEKIRKELEPTTQNRGTRAPDRPANREPILFAACRCVCAGRP